MEKAKQAISDFTSRDGQHKTSVQQDVRESVTDEHRKAHQHENVTAAVDRDVHKDHHHTVVQPLEHTEVLPEKHSHRVADVEHRTFHHGNEQELKDTLDRDIGKYKDTTTTHETTHSSTTAPMVQSERVHHHVHEHIQPVLHKEVIQGHVVHTTVPIHETHHVAPVHHETSVLPTKTLAEFEKGTGSLHAKEATHVGTVEGCPQGIGSSEFKSHKIHGEHGHQHGQLGEQAQRGQIAEQGQLGREGQMGREGHQAHVKEGELGEHSRVHPNNGFVGAPGAGAGGTTGAAAAAAKAAHHNTSTTGNQVCSQSHSRKEQFANFVSVPRWW
ncbi:hypothetical protein BKA56DRAFT_472903 [Ilyonectria sp. MPI-CAGE-AT-0026]|nr:hypothetical protein BKA56DRAFT_472903 [Ilyonectria sp. MPI-CAGE-AT-0026]